MSDEVNKNRKRFIEALRSGKYKQTRGTLKSKDCHCAIGVAYALLGAKWMEFAGGDHLVEATKMRRKLSEFLGADSETITLIIDMNDSLEYTFEQIAEELERKWNLTS